MFGSCFRTLAVILFHFFFKRDNGRNTVVSIVLFLHVLVLLLMILQRTVTSPLSVKYNAAGMTAIIIAVISFLWIRPVIFHRFGKSPLTECVAFIGRFSEAGLLE